MEQTIVRDMMFLSVASIPATKEDVNIAQDLLDTLQANLKYCVGLAANMIGYRKCIIAFVDKGTIKVMYNPTIIKTSGKYYETEEGCLSLDGVRKAKRYETIKVQYEDFNWKKKIQTFSGFTAQIIQHEIDHCKGIII